MPRLYPTPFPIGTRFKGPVRDAEGFCRVLLDKAFDEKGMFLRPDTYDDSLQELIIILWRLESSYDPERTETFELYARWVISARAIDVGPRRVLGRTGSRAHNYVFDELDTSVGDRLVEDLGTGQSDQVQDSGRTSRWLQPDYDRKRAWSDALLGIRPARGTETRDHADAQPEPRVPVAA